MLERLLHRTPRIAERATILSGPYAGRSGPISAIDGEPPRFEVLLDECCHPALARGDIRLGGGGWLDRIGAADLRRRRSPVAGYSRAPDIAVAIAISEVLASRSGDDRASSVVRDIEERHRAHNE